MSYAWLVLGLPLLGTIINGIFGRFLPKKLVGWLACALVAGSLGVAVAVLVQILSLPVEARHIVSTLYRWVTAGTFHADIAILLDPLSVVMMLVVTFVGFLIHIYSIGYMADDHGFSRFFTYMNLFIFSMLLLVMSDNFLLLFAGWELVGICSYLLISFWYERPTAAAAGKKAFITTRIGDVGFTLGVVLVFVTFRTVSYEPVFASVGSAASGAITAIAIFLFIGAVGKSAQFPLYVWLPDAMEGPTPVSALIHAATMVTAGVYMIARVSPLYVHAPYVLAFIAAAGAVTALFAATMAVVHNDSKRVLAYSTISQLGLMFLAVGVGAFTVAIFHLVTHAFFKALLFLCAGSVMHSLNGETDLRKMGGLAGKLKVTYWASVIGALALSGIAPLSGFFSKDAILSSSLLSPSGYWLFYTFGLATSLLTAFYIFRSLFLTFYGAPRMSDRTYEHAHESPPVMLVPMIILAIGAIFAGFLGVPKQLWPWGTGRIDIIQQFLAPAVARESIMTEAPVIFGALVVAALAVGVIGILAARKIYAERGIASEPLAQRVPRLYDVLIHKYWIDEAYDLAFVRPGKAFAGFLWRIIDVGLIDGLVNGVARAVAGSSLLLTRVQTGYIRNYALGIFIGAVALVAYLIVR